MNRAMAEFGEIHPGGDNFWWGEIHSIKGILTLAAMLENKYSKELINELTNETYKRLLSGSFITKNVEFPFCNPTTPKREKLYQLLMKYSDIVNPFGNEQFSIKEPIQYLDTVGVNLSLIHILYTHATNKITSNTFFQSFATIIFLLFFNTLIIILYF